jgi:hypothetical protein
MSIAVNPTGTAVLMRRPDFQTLDVRVECRIAGMTTHPCALYPANTDGAMQ